jgi:drug/metabolite transporter (DMT)-like permease
MVDMVMNSFRKSAAPARAMGAARSLPQSALVAATLLWGGNFVAGKALAGDVPPVAISFWRWALALLVLLPLGFGEVRRHRGPLLAHWRLIAAVGATGIAGYTLCFYQALAATTAINALLFISTAPLLITLASWGVYRDRVTPWQVLGTVVSSLGAVVVIAHGDAARLLALRFNRGDLWILAGVLVWVAYAILLRRRPAALPPQPFFTASVLAGVALLVPLYGWQFARGERLALTGPAVAGVLYVALGASALGYACWTRGVAALGPGRAGTFLHLIPVFGTTMAVIFLGERLARYHVVGAVLVAGGLGLASLRRAPAAAVATRPQVAATMPQSAARHAPHPQFGTAAERAQ